jgi:hypothetical protein
MYRVPPPPHLTVTLIDSLINLPRWKLMAFVFAGCAIHYLVPRNPEL